MNAPVRKTPPKSLGFLLASWISAHCVVPAGWQLNNPFRLTGWQLKNAVEFYTVKDNIEFNQSRPAMGSAFKWRRGQIVGGH